MKKLRIAIVFIFVISLGLYAALHFYNAARVDDTIPQIHCPEEALILSAQCNTDEAFLEGLRAWDDKDGDITSRVMVQGITKTFEEGEPEISYVVADSDGNTASAVRPVIYDNSIVPKFYLSKPLCFYNNGTLDLPSRIGAEDLLDGDISGQIQYYFDTSISGLESGITGSYPMRFEVTNSLGATATIQLDIELRSYVSGEPNIELREYLVYLKAGENFNPSSYVAAVSGGDKDQVRVSSTVNTSVPGVYSVRYSCPGYDESISGTTSLYVVVE